MKSHVNRFLAYSILAVLVLAFQNCSNKPFSILQGATSTSSTAPTVSQSVVCDLKPTGTLNDIENFVTSGCTEINTPPDAHLTLTASSTKTLDIPETVTIRLGRNSTWELNSNLTINIKGRYDIPLERQRFFLGAGAIITTDTYSNLGCPVNSRLAYPEWFGAKAGDGMDDSIAINQALQFGNDIELAAGNYDLQNRIFVIRGSATNPLLGPDRQVLGGQHLHGQSLTGTTLNQMPNANIVHTPNGRLGRPEYQALYSALFVQDFIVGISSDCGRVSNLTIDGSRLPDDFRTLSNFDDPGTPIVSGIQISSMLGFKWAPLVKTSDPEVKNVKVSNVRISRPASNCINIQSARGVDGVELDSISCTARTSRPNTSGMTVEAYGFRFNNNTYKNISLTNSQFTGGKAVFYLAGGENILFNNVTGTGEPGTVLHTLIYTGDMSFPLTATFKNSRFTHMYPPPASGDESYDQASQAVMVVAGRGYAKSYSDMPFLQATETSLKMENCTVESKAYSSSDPSARLIPLVRDLIGLSTLIEITKTVFRGGTYAVLSKDVREPTGFGGIAYFPNVPARDFTPAEIDGYKVAHSSFRFSQSEFYDQAFSAINLEFGNLQVFDTNFFDTGLSPAALDYPIVDLGSQSNYGPLVQNSIQNNSYSGVNATAFLRMPRNLSVVYSSNTAITTGKSRPASSMESIRFRP